MSARDVRDAVLDVYARILRARGMTMNDADLTALELLAAAEGRGVKFTAAAHTDDPNADWTRPVEPAEPGGDYRAARARLAATPPPGNGPSDD